MTDETTLAKALFDAKVQAQITEIENQRNIAFTRAAEKAGEVAQLKVIAGDLQGQVKTLNEELASTKNELASVREELSLLQEQQTTLPALGEDGEAG